MNRLFRRDQIVETGERDVEQFDAAPTRVRLGLEAAPAGSVDGVAERGAAGTVADRAVVDRDAGKARDQSGGIAG
jgi:hypothetical protein